MYALEVAHGERAPLGRQVAGHHRGGQLRQPGVEPHIDSVALRRRARAGGEEERPVHRLARLEALPAAQVARNLPGLGLRRVRVI
jgi:hypothetical protein